MSPRRGRRTMRWAAGWSTILLGELLLRLVLGGGTGAGPGRVGCAAGEGLRKFLHWELVLKLAFVLGNFAIPSSCSQSRRGPGLFGV